MDVFSVINRETATGLHIPASRCLIPDECGRQKDVHVTSTSSLSFDLKTSLTLWYRLFRFRGEILRECLQYTNKISMVVLRAMTIVLLYYNATSWLGADVYG